VWPIKRARIGSRARRWAIKAVRQLMGLASGSMFVIGDLTS